MYCEAEYCLLSLKPLCTEIYILNVIWAGYKGVYDMSPVLVLVVDNDVYQVEEVQWNSTDQAE